MSLLSNAIAIPQKGGYTLTNSLRFWAGQTTYLDQTLPGNDGRTESAFSIWVKRGKLGSEQRIIETNNTGALYSAEYLGFTSGDKLIAKAVNAGAYELQTTQVFRDTSSWYHIVWIKDITNSTAADRIRLYVNGERITSFSTATYHSSGSPIFSSNDYTDVGRSRHPSATYYYEGFMTDMYHISGSTAGAQNKTPSDFGEYDSITGAWQPKKYTGTYGTNGFHLDFSDQTGNTATTIGKDTSGNGNNFTPVNISVTGGVNTWNAGSTDVPTLTDEDTANYATLNWNNADNASGQALITNSSLYYYGNGTHGHAYLTIMPTSGKWYFEVRQVDNNAGGIGFRTDYPKTSTTYAHEANKYWIYNASGANFYRLNETSISMLSSPTPATSDILQMAWDVDAGKMWFGINNTWYDSSWGTTGNPSSGTNPFFTVTAGSNMFPFLETGGQQMRFYSGMSGFHYTPPTGFKKLNTYNLPDSAIKDGSKYFVTALYEGNGAVRSISNTITDASGVETGNPIQFSPDLVWIKSRSNTHNHNLYDSVRGIYKGIQSSNNNAEYTNSGTLTSFNSDGFSIGSASGVNTTSENLVAWNWRGSDSSPVSNTDGTITSTVSANTTAGFSIISYAGSNAAGTIGHGLGKTPDVLITKNKNEGTDGNWVFWHSSMTNAFATDAYYMYLNSTQAEAVSGGVFYKGTDINTTTYGFQSGNTNVNASGDNYIAYCFAEVEGFSKFGSYTGNGTTPNGSFVYTGFRPAFIIVKRSDAAYGWVMFDNKRDTYNYERRYLLANASDVEGTQVEGSGGWTFDFFSNGFRPTGGSAANAINASGGTYIYMAFAENPFKNSLAR